MSFDKLAALYVFCMNYHKGQWSREYRIMSRIVRQYRLRLSDSTIDAIESEGDNDEWFEARYIYAQLVANHG